MFFEGAISADSHVQEPPACFTDCIDPGYRNQAPRIELDGKGRHVHVIEGLTTVIPLGMVVVSYPGIEYKDACTNAYNRWLEGFCSALPERLFGLGLTSVRNADAANLWGANSNSTRNRCRIVFRTPQVPYLREESHPHSRHCSTPSNP